MNQVLGSFQKSSNTIAQLADEFDICCATVRSYIKAYNAGGLQKLRAKKSPGRPTKVGHLTQDDWRDILRQTPNQYEKLNTDSRQWTLELLVRYASENQLAWAKSSPLFTW